MQAVTQTLVQTRTHTQRIGLRMGREEGKKSLIFTFRAVSKCIITSVLPTKAGTVHFPTALPVREWLWQGGAASLHFHTTAWKQEKYHKRNLVQSWSSVCLMSWQSPQRCQRHPKPQDSRALKQDLQPPALERSAVPWVWLWAPFLQPLRFSLLYHLDTNWFTLILGALSSLLLSQPEAFSSFWQSCPISLLSEKQGRRTRCSP